MSNNQEKYDELDNIIRTIDSLVNDIADKYYIDVLNSIKYEAQTDMKEIGEELQEEYSKEEQEMNYQFERRRV